MLEVDFLAAAPGWMCGFEEVFGANDLAFEESSECGMVVGEPYRGTNSVTILDLTVAQHTLYTQVAAKKRVRQIYIL